MNRLPAHRRVQVLRCLVEGMSIRATSRLTDVAKVTILKLLEAAGQVCDDYQDRHLVNLQCRNVQCDEIWSFVHCKQKRAPFVSTPSAGDVWTWLALCADSKLIITWRVGDRSALTACEFLLDLQHRLVHRVQLSTDGHPAYLEAVDGAFWKTGVDYAQLIKQYGKGHPQQMGHDHRYSPTGVVGMRRVSISGHPDPTHVSTSYVERANLEIRSGNRRFTRLTLAFSKKVENHAHSVALHFFYRNFCWLHSTLRCTPAMAAGVTERIWEIEDIVRLIDEATPPPGSSRSLPETSPVGRNFKLDHYRRLFGG